MHQEDISACVVTLDGSSAAIASTVRQHVVDRPVNSVCAADPSDQRSLHWPQPDRPRWQEPETGLANRRDSRVPRREANPMRIPRRSKGSASPSLSVPADRLHSTTGSWIEVASGEDGPSGPDGSAVARTPSGADAFSSEPSMDEVWDRIAELMVNHPGTYKRDPSATPKLSAEERAKKKRKRRLYFRTLDVIAFLVWAALFVKVFVADIDRLLVSAVAPGLLWLLDFRFFIALGVLALILILAKVKRLGWSLIYITFFPLIVLLWKIPRVIAVNVNRPAISFGILNVLTSFVLGFKPVVIALAVACLAALLILISANSVLIMIGIGLMALLLLVWLGLSIRNGLRPSRFTSTQQKWISAIIGTKALEMFREPTGGLQPSNARLWGPDNANQYIANAGLGLVMYRVSYYWAYSLDQYRSSPARVLFSGLAVLTLVVEVALGFAFMNYGLWKMDASQFQTLALPSFWTFVYYSFAGCWFGEIAAVAPVGSLAIGLKIANGVLGALVVLTVVAALFVSYRDGKSDEDSRRAVDALRNKADSLGEQVGGSFAESLDDLERRLGAIGWGLLGVSTWLAARVPPGWATGPSKHNE